jgi:hypothetical protein
MNSSLFRAKWFKFLVLAALMSAMALASVYWMQAKGGADYSASSPTNRPQVVIGDLGGMKVNIPSYYVELLEYEGDPGWSDKRSGAVPARTYQSRMASFGVTARYPDMAGLSSPVMRADKDKYTDADTPWISLTILSGPNYPGDGMLDRLAKPVVDCIKTSWSDDFKKEGGKLFGGLDLYVQQGDSIDGKPLRESRPDIYVHQDEQGHVKAYISCSNAKYPAVLCQQFFSMEVDGLDILVQIFYRRTALTHWRGMQEKARHLILSWKTPETPSPSSASAIQH